MLLEVVRYGVMDSQKEVFERGCFGNVEGTHVQLTLMCNQQKLLGYGILSDTQDALSVTVPDSVLAKITFRPEAALSFSAKQDISNEYHRTIIKARVMDIGLVPHGGKVPQ